MGKLKMKIMPDHGGYQTNNQGGHIYKRPAYNL